MVVFDAASSIALFVNIFVSVYILTIFLYIILSWIRVPYSLQPVQRFLYDVCEPYLALWRRIIPMVGPLDLSPIAAIFGLIILQKLIDALFGRVN